MQIYKALKSKQSLRVDGESEVEQIRCRVIQNKFAEYSNVDTLELIY